MDGATRLETCLLCTGMWCVDGRTVDVQYSNWQSGFPHENMNSDCVLVTQNNDWVTWHCRERQRYVCQSQWQLITALNLYTVCRLRPIRLCVQHRFYSLFSRPNWVSHTEREINHSVFLPRDGLLSAVYAVVVCLCVCVCVCVCHTPVLYQNG